MAEMISSVSLDRPASPDYGPVPPVRNLPSEAEAKAQKADKPPRPSELPVQVATKDAVKLIRDEESGRAVVQILDRRTGEVIYEIPPEELKNFSELVDKTNGVVINTVV